MGEQVVEYRHQVIFVKAGGKTFQFAVRDDGTIEKLALAPDEHNGAHAAAMTHLKQYRRWFGHWIPVDPRSTSQA